MTYRRSDLILHWGHFFTYAIMIASGLMIYWANPEYGWPTSEQLEFIHLDASLGKGLSWHIPASFVFTLLTLSSFFFTFKNGKIRQLFLALKNFKIVVINLKNLKNPLLNVPDEPYNPMQAAAYLLVYFNMLGLLLTGYMIYKPVQLFFLTDLFGGYELCRRVHYFCTWFVVIFVIIHILQVIRAGTGKFMQMIRAGDQ